MEAGNRLVFLETVDDERVLTIHGSVYEKYPLLDNKYVVYKVDREEGIVTFRNWDHPHHVVMWWLEWDGEKYFISKSNVVARFELVYFTS